MQLLNYDSYLLNYGVHLAAGNCVSQGDATVRIFYNVSYCRPALENLVCCLHELEPAGLRESTHVGINFTVTGAGRTQRSLLHISPSETSECS